MNALEQYRVASRLSFQSLAEMIGVDRGRVHQWCRGARPIPSKRVARIAAVTCVARWQLRPDLYEPPPEDDTQNTRAAAAGLARLAAIKLTDADLARLLLVTEDTVRGWRRGASRMSLHNAKQVEREFGIPRHLLRPDLFEPPLEASVAGADLESGPPTLRGVA